MVKVEQITTLDELWENGGARTGNVLVDAMVEFLRTTHSHQVGDAILMYDVPKRLLEDAMLLFVGMTPNEMISRWRTMQALDALVNTAEDEAVLAQRLGFGHVEVMRRCVRRYYGTTPHVIRKGFARRNTNYAYNDSKAQRSDVERKAEEVRAAFRRE